MECIHKTELHINMNWVFSREERKTEEFLPTQVSSRGTRKQTCKVNPKDLNIFLKASLSKTKMKRVGKHAILFSQHINSIF